MRGELADKVWEERLQQLVLLIKILKGNNIFKGSGSKIKEKKFSELFDNQAFTWAFFSVPHVWLDLSDLEYKTSVKQSIPILSLCKSLK